MEAQALLGHFEVVKEFHLGKQGNEAAHALARFGQQVDLVARWWHQISMANNVKSDSKDWKMKYCRKTTS